MRASTSRVVYCAGLLLATACAVLPKSAPAPVAETSRASPQSVEARLAHSIRDRIELAATFGNSHPRLAEAALTEAALRKLAFAGNIAEARHQLILALADELADALANRSRLAGQTDASDRTRADAVVSGLTAAINAEVHRNHV